MKVSLVIPCFNEEANIQKGVLDKIANYTRDNVLFGEVIIVDDGSTDESKKVIKEKYLSKFSKFRLIENIHQGKAASVITGIKAAGGDYVIFTDIDLATPIEEADKLTKEAKKGAKIIIGSRNSLRPGAPLSRKLMARGFIVIRDLFLNLDGIKDTQCGFKMLQKKTALKILEGLRVFKKSGKIKGSSVSAGFDLEFLFLAKKLGLAIVEVPVTWRHVETKNVNMVIDSFETLRDILKIKAFDISGKYA